MPKPTSNPLTITGERTLSRNGVTTMGGQESRSLLLIATSRTVTEVVPIGHDAALTVGRGDGASVRLADPMLSRVHARFRRTGDKVMVTDLDSRNGTFVEGRRVTEAELSVGQRVVLGGVTVEVRAALTRDAAMMGMADYTEIQARLADELARARDFRRPLSVLLVRPRERLGASAYAVECRLALRSSDRVGLFDRHSLLVVMPECEAERARATAMAIEATAPNGIGLHVGAATYPVDGSSLDGLVGACLERAGRASTEVALPAPNTAPRSPAMQDVERLVERLAPSRISVLVCGETGVGKELIARAIHDGSPRARCPFIATNCGAIPEKLVETVFFGHLEGAFTGATRNAPGLFQSASRGTVFLDEVAELSPSAQAALLRVLDTGSFRAVGAARETSVDVRVIAASHRDLRAMAEAGQFRADLYHRLSGATIVVPPLRERRTEVRDLAYHFARGANAWGASFKDFTPDALAALERHAWPGNVRELRNVVERALALSENGVVTTEDLPPALLASAPAASVPTAPPSPLSPPLPGAGLDLRLEVERHERGLIERALERTGGHRRKAAELLRVPLRTLERKLQRLGNDDEPDGE